MAAHVRTYRRLVLSSFGIPLSLDDLTAYQRAVSLLSRFIGHLLLFFHEKLPHRDISACDTTYTPGFTPMQGF